MKRYDNATILNTAYTNRPYYKGKYYPNVPLSKDDIYVITTVGDRLDSFAFAYYGDSTLWWIISMANNNITKGALYPAPGTQLRIPTDIGQIMNLYQKFNQRR